MVAMCVKVVIETRSDLSLGLRSENKHRPRVTAKGCHQLKLMQEPTGKTNWYGIRDRFTDTGIGTVFMSLATK